jgi:RNA polymerase sigma-70 factor, ECF subfamily
MNTFNAELQVLMPDLMRFARSLTRNEDNAHDLVQDCVERALRKKALFQAGTSLKSWLFTLMRNIFISGKRREALDRRSMAMMDGTRSHVQRANQVNSIFLKETVAAIGTLSKSERQAIMVLGLHDGSQQKLAKSRGEPVGTVKSRLCRGRAHLRTALGMEPTAMAAA